MSGQALKQLAGQQIHEQRIYAPGCPFLPYPRKLSTLHHQRMGQPQMRLIPKNWTRFIGLWQSWMKNWPISKMIPNQPKQKSKLAFFNHLMRPYSLAKARKQMGVHCFSMNLFALNVVFARMYALYHAIEMNPMPVFNTDNCHACWACFNHCPEQAIYTEKIRG